jgi:dihydrofolate reductase
MRKVIVSEFMSLDGVIENPAWTFDYISEEQEKYKLEELRAADALLLGRVTYEGFAAAWPTVVDEVGFADQMNSMRKYVVSTTLREGTWNNTSIIREDVAGAVRHLKSQPGKHILVGGSGNLVQTLRTHDLIDEYRLMLFPVILGRGIRLFQEVRTVT